MERVIISGHFDPLHTGHLDLLEIARNYGLVTVIVNNDTQTLAKKGFYFTPHVYRVRIMRALSVVDDVVLSIDQDGTITKTLESLSPIPRYYINGGDVVDLDQIPQTEQDVCLKYAIKIVLGQGAKVLSSLNMPKECLSSLCAETG